MVDFRSIQLDVLLKDLKFAISLPFLPKDELVFLNEQPIGDKKLHEIAQQLHAEATRNTASAIRFHVRTRLDCSEFIIKNTCDGMFKIVYADAATCSSLMNCSLNKEEGALKCSSPLVSSSTSSISSNSSSMDSKFVSPLLDSVLKYGSLNEHEQDSAWLIHTHGYSLVKIISKRVHAESGAEVFKFKVRLDNGHLIEVNEEDLEKINPPQQFDFCEDLSQLRFINETGLMHTIRQRYQTLGLTHSYLGTDSMLILSPGLVRPLASKADSIYGDKVVSLLKGCKHEEMPPHIYSYAQNVYRHMLSTRQDQSIVLMGHAGSGKTTNARHVLNYLFKVASPHATSLNNNFTGKILRFLYYFLLFWI